MQVYVFVAVQADDRMVTDQKSTLGRLREILRRRFRFGRWQSHTASYSGRQVKVILDRIGAGQKKYILEEVQIFSASRHRQGDKESPRTPEEFKEFQSFVSRVNGLARASCSNSSGTASWRRG